jgi:hypothetical protein
MKKFLFRFILLLAPVSVCGSPVFDSYFTDGVLRIDFILSGNHASASMIPSEIKREKSWGGSHNTLISNPNFGTFRFQVYDGNSKELIFSRGFSPLFQEWQYTPEARKTYKAFYQVIRFPFPKKSVLLKISKRNSEGQFYEIYSGDFDPDDYFVINENAPDIPVESIYYSGVPENNIDIAILAEGYTSEEMGKFLQIPFSRLPHLRR